MDFKASKEGQREKKRIYLEEKIKEAQREKRTVIYKLNKNEKEKENIKVVIEFIQKFDNIFPDDVYGHPRNFFEQDNKLRLISEKSVRLHLKRKEGYYYKREGNSSEYEKTRRTRRNKGQVQTGVGGGEPKPHKYEK